MKRPKFFTDTINMLLDKLATKERICDELGDKRSKYLNEIAEIKQELSKRGITNFKPKP